jgi:hypothetical protein
MRLEVVLASKWAKKPDGNLELTEWRGTNMWKVPSKLLLYLFTKLHVLPGDEDTFSFWIEVKNQDGDELLPRAHVHLKDIRAESYIAPPHLDLHIPIRGPGHVVVEVGQGDQVLERFSYPVNVTPRN